MPYAALPDRRMAYDNDGTIVYIGQAGDGAVTELTSGQKIELNDNDQTVAISRAKGAANPDQHRLYFFFPEQREITGLWAQAYPSGTGGSISGLNLTGSNDTGNGENGTWETASFPGGVPNAIGSSKTFDEWRTGIKAVSFTGPKKNIRLSFNGSTNNALTVNWVTAQIYGEAAAGAMTHDLVYIDHDTTPGVEFATPEDFGDLPLGTTEIRQFRIKNTSATRTATGINIQCNDPNFVIAEDAAGPWVVTINIASLAPGAESATFHLRCTAPAPGAALVPRFARIVTVCDPGFFG